MKALIKAIVGILVVALIGYAALRIDGAPGSAAALEATLNERVSDALGDTARSWATFEIDGQKVILAGEAPSEDARQALIERISSAEWDGGVLIGGVTAIDHSRLTIARQEEPKTIAAESSTVAADAEAMPDTADETPLTLPADPARDQAETEVLAANDAVPEEPDCIDRLQTVTGETRIQFSSARAELDDAGRAELREVAMIFAECPQAQLRITGHTDASGNASRNMQLSADRADAVRTFLTSAGAPATRMSARGVGSSQPLVSNATPAGREQNRRIEIEVVADDE